MLGIQPSHGEVIRTGMLLQFIISLFHQFNPLAPLLNVALSAQTASIRFMKLTCCFTTLLFSSNIKLRIFSQLDSLDFFFFLSQWQKKQTKNEKRFMKKTLCCQRCNTMCQQTHICNHEPKYEILTPVSGMFSMIHGLFWRQEASCKHTTPPLCVADV